MNTELIILSVATHGHYANKNKNPILLDRNTEILWPVSSIMRLFMPGLVSIYFLHNSSQLCYDMLPFTLGEEKSHYLTLGEKHVSSNNSTLSQLIDCHVHIVRSNRIIRSNGKIFPIF